MLAEGVTHRILLPLLAFLSTFFFILLRNFWMANHCLGNAEQQGHNFSTTKHSQKDSVIPNCIKSSTSQTQLPQIKEVSSREKLLLVINIFFFFKLKRASSHLIYTMKTRHQGKNLTKSNYCNLNIILITVIYFIVKSDKCTMQSPLKCNFVYIVLNYSE